MPMLLALSIRQPWAWAIVRAQKNVENREWGGCAYQGPLLLHVGKVCTRAEYSSAASSIQMMRADLGLPPIEVPPLSELARGCFIGIARLTRVDRHPGVGVVSVAGRDGVTRSLDWSRGYCGWRLAGCIGLQLDDVRELGPVPYSGALGLFNVPSLQLPDVYRRAWNDLKSQGGPDAT